MKKIFYLMALAMVLSLNPASKEYPTAPSEATEPYLEQTDEDKLATTTGARSMLTVDFEDLDALDYNSVLQPVKGNNTNKNIMILESPFWLTLGFLSEELTECVGESSKDYLSFLQSQPQPLNGLLEIYVDKKGVVSTGGTRGVVVNFTVQVGGYEYFLTTGHGMNTVEEYPTHTIVTKTGGFIRINRKPIGARGNIPWDTMIGYIIVDYKFTVSK